MFDKRMSKNKGRHHIYRGKIITEKTINLNDIEIEKINRKIL